MSSNKDISKDSIKELYKESKKRVRLIMNLLGKPDINKQSPLPDDKSFESISNLINSIMGSMQFDSDNQYKDSIIVIADWLNCAFNKKYLTENEHYSPNPLYVVKKGTDILHSFLHRDLRRRQFSSQEDEIFRSFLNMIAALPDPRQKKLSQDDVNSVIDDLLKSS